MGLSGNLRLFIFSLSFLFIHKALYASLSCRAFIEATSPNAEALVLGQTLRVELQTDSGLTEFRAHFLGLSKNIDGSSAGIFLFDPMRMKIHFVGMEHFKIYDLSNGNKEVSEDRLHRVVRSINQEGGTCAAYAIFNCFRQLYENGHIGNGLVVHHMREETARNRFAIHIVTDYYSDGNHVGVEADVARDLGYRTDRLPTPSYPILAAEIRRVSYHLGWPMLIYFDVSSSMSRTEYEIINHETGAVADRRLWLPNSSSYRNGGHEILLVQAFTDLRGREWLIMVDSNWQAPRLWSIDELKKVRNARIGGWVVWQSEPNPDTLPPAPPQPFFMGPDAPPLREPDEF